MAGDINSLNLLVFHDIYATAGPSRKNEKFDIKREPFFYSHIHLASLPFRPSRCLRALSLIKNHTLWENLNKRRTQVANF